MIVFRTCCCLLACALLTACATVDREGGKTLGSAGQLAAQTLANQTEKARQSIDSLPEWQAVGGILACANIADIDMRQACVANAVKAGLPARVPPALAGAYKTLGEVMEKRLKAMETLQGAYKAFGDLSTYDAGEAAAQGISELFSSVNDLSKAAAAIAPAGAVLPPITQTFTKGAAGIAALTADARQAKAMKMASHDLAVASDALAKALTVERDKVASAGLFDVLQAERDRLYAQFARIGAVSSVEVLKPMFAEIAPDTANLQKPNDQYANLMALAASASIAHRSKRQRDRLVRAYDAALVSLEKLAAQHRSFEHEEPLDVAGLLAEVKHLESIVNSIDKSK